MLALPRLGGPRHSLAHIPPPSAALVTRAVPASLDTCMRGIFRVLLGSRLRSDESEQRRLLGTARGGRHRAGCDSLRSGAPAFMRACCLLRRGRRGILRTWRGACP